MIKVRHRAGWPTRVVGCPTCGGDHVAVFCMSDARWEPIEPLIALRMLTDPRVTIDLHAWAEAPDVWARTFHPATVPESR